MPMIHRLALVLLARPWAVLQGVFCLSLHRISFLIRRSIRHENLENVLTWDTSLLTGFASQPGVGAELCLGQVVGVCLWSQPQLKGCVDLVLGELCASQIFSFPADNLWLFPPWQQPNAFLFPNQVRASTEVLQLLSFRSGRCEGADKVAS